MEFEQLNIISSSIEELLRKSDHPDKAQWLLDKRATLTHGTAEENQAALEEILSYIQGKGSLSDLSLRPAAKEKLNDLLDRFYWEIVYLIAESDVEDRD